MTELELYTLRHAFIAAGNGSLWRYESDEEDGEGRMFTFAGEAASGARLATGAVSLPPAERNGFGLFVSAVADGENSLRLAASLAELVAKGLRALAATERKACVVPAMPADFTAWSDRSEAELRWCIAVACCENRIGAVSVAARVPERTLREMAAGDANNPVLFERLRAAAQHHLTSEAP